MSTELTIHHDHILDELDRLQQLARYTTTSGLWGVRSVEQAVALMALCRAEGLPAAKAVQLYHIIDGRPAMRADAILARFLDAGGRVEWHRYDDDEVSATFSHPQGGSVRVTWDRSRADKAGYLQRSPTWRTHTRAMLRARCISEGVRTVCPGVVCGIYTPEEIKDDMQADGSAKLRGALVTTAPERAIADAPAIEIESAREPAEPVMELHPEVEADVGETQAREPAPRSRRASRYERAIAAAEAAHDEASAKAAIREVVDALGMRWITHEQQSTLEEALSRLRRLAGYE